MRSLPYIQYVGIVRKAWTIDLAFYNLAGIGSVHSTLLLPSSLIGANTTSISSIFVFISLLPSHFGKCWIVVVLRSIALASLLLGVFLPPRVHSDLRGRRWWRGRHSRHIVNYRHFLFPIAVDFDSLLVLYIISIGYSSSWEASATWLAGLLSTPLRFRQPSSAILHGRHSAGC